MHKCVYKYIKYATFCTQPMMEKVPSNGIYFVRVWQNVILVALGFPWRQNHRISFSLYSTESHLPTSQSAKVVLYLEVASCPQLLSLWNSFTGSFPDKSLKQIGRTFHLVGRVICHHERMQTNKIAHSRKKIALWEKPLIETALLSLQLQAQSIITYLVVISEAFCSAAWHNIYILSLINAVHLFLHQL